MEKLQGSPHPDSFQHLNPIMQHIHAHIIDMAEHWCLSVCDTRAVSDQCVMASFSCLLPGFGHKRHEAQDGKGWLDGRWSWARGQLQGQLSHKSMWHVHSGLPTHAWATQAVPDLLALRQSTLHIHLIPLFSAVPLHPVLRSQGAGLVGDSGCGSPQVPSVVFDMMPACVCVCVVCMWAGLVLGAGGHGWSDFRSNAWFRRIQLIECLFYQLQNFSAYFCIFNYLHQGANQSFSPLSKEEINLLKSYCWCILD